MRAYHHALGAGLGDELALRPLRGLAIGAKGVDDDRRVIAAGAHLLDQADPGQAILAASHVRDDDVVVVHRQQPQRVDTAGDRVDREPVILEEALLAFAGVVVVVSHDRYFLNRVCTGIVAFEGEGRVVYSEGNYDYYLEKKQRANVLPPRKEIISDKTPAKTSAATRPRKLSFKETKELEGMEEAIAAVEEEISRIEQLFGDPDFNRKYGPQMNELTADLAANKEKLNALFARWEELEAIRAGAEAPQS